MTIPEKLNWDSDFFNRSIGRLNIYDAQNFDAVEFLKIAKQEYDLVYVFSHQNLLPVDKVTEANLELVDIMITMSMPFIKTHHSNKKFDLKNSLTKEEIMGCYEVAEQTSIVSRFYNEPVIGPEKAKALYRRWIDNALNGSFCDGVLITKYDEIVTGIHVVSTDLKNNTGTCSLIGVNSNLKGKGIGKVLWDQALGYWASYDNISTCRVPFSINNKESFNFHLKIGFNYIESIKYIYHYRNTNI